MIFSLIRGDKNPSASETIGFLGIVFLFCTFLYSILYPDLFLVHTRRLVTPHETMAPWESTYILVSHFFNGGIQLWDSYDQMNNAYFVLANGVYGVVNIITAAVFILLSPFFTHPAEALYHVHLIVFYSLCSLIRIIGGYVLLRLFIHNRTAIFIALVYLNTILTSYMMTPGIITHVVYSFFPLVLFYIISFFRNATWKNFLWAIGALVLCFTSTPLFTLGYFYQALHVCIVLCAIGFIVKGGFFRPKALEDQKNYVRACIGLGVCAAFIVLPYVFWEKSLMHDFYIHGSGIGQTQGRFNNVFNPHGYFNIDGKSFSNPLEFLGTSLDYFHNMWGASWLFLGASTFLLSFAGVMLSKNALKHLFWIAIVGIVLLNTACFEGNIHILSDYMKTVNATTFHWGELFIVLWVQLSSVVHWLNFLTNPFSFLVRSFQMTSLLVSMLFFPLIALGVQALLELKGSSKRAWILLVIYLGILIWALSGGAGNLSVYNIGTNSMPALKWYLVGITSLCAVMMVCAIFKIQKLILVVLTGIMLIDLSALVYYKGMYKHDPDKVLAVQFQSPMESQHPVVPDYQNPKLHPLREYINTNSQIRPSLFPGQCMFGAFYQFVPMGRFFLPWSIYEPRHISFKNFYPDLNVQQYLNANPKTMFFADYGIDDRIADLRKICELKIHNRVALVSVQEQNKDFIKSAGQLHLHDVPVASDKATLNLDWTKAHTKMRSNGIEWSFKLPNDFPSYLTTSSLSPDKDNWHLELGGRTLVPIQGVLTQPYSYDVQNIHQKTLTILLPKTQSQEQLTLEYTRLPGITRVWKNTYDDLGFDYSAPYQGWLVFHKPYDPKWQLIIDGKDTFISRVNGYFIGAPLSEGHHKILLRYWPSSILRVLIPISMILSVILFFCVLSNALKQSLQPSRM